MSSTPLTGEPWSPCDSAKFSCETLHPGVHVEATWHKPSVPNTQHGLQLGLVTACQDTDTWPLGCVLTVSWTRALVADHLSTIQWSCFPIRILEIRRQRVHVLLSCLEGFLIGQITCKWMQRTQGFPVQLCTVLFNLMSWPISWIKLSWMSGLTLDLSPSDDNWDLGHCVDSLYFYLFGPLSYACTWFSDVFAK